MIPQDTPIEKKYYDVNLKVLSSHVNRYTVFAESEEEAVKSAAEQLYRDTRGWGVDGYDIVSIKEK